MNDKQGLSWLILIGIALFFSGCSNSNEENLQEWMVDQRNSLRPKIDPVNEPKVFTPQIYQNGMKTEPFDSRKLTMGTTSEASKISESSYLVQPEIGRRKEPLESVPLDTMRYVGSLEKKLNSVALLKVDQLLYQVKTGGYIGQNYGKILKIDETELTVREIVQDASGEWIERMAILKIQEEIK